MEQTSTREGAGSFPPSEKRCTRCNVLLNPDPEHGNVYRYYDKKKHRTRTSEVCKQCQGERNRESRANAARKRIVALPPVGSPTTCGACGISRGNIVGDVNQETGRRYGYLCVPCSRVVRQVEENISRLRAVLSYMEITRDQSKERDIH